MIIKGSDVTISTKSEDGDWREIGKVESVKTDGLDPYVVNGIWGANENLTGEGINLFPKGDVHRPLSDFWLHAQDEATLQAVSIGKDASFEMTGNTDNDRPSGDVAVVGSGGPRKSYEEIVGVPAEFSEAIKRVGTEPLAPSNRAGRRRLAKQQRKQK